MGVWVQEIISLKGLDNPCGILDYPLGSRLHTHFDISTYSLVILERQSFNTPCSMIIPNIHSSSKETQLFWTPFSRWPWVTDPDPGSCTFYQIVTKSIGKMKYTTKFIYLHSSPKERQLSMLRFFWRRVYLLIKWRTFFFYTHLQYFRLTPDTFHESLLFELLSLYFIFT